MKAFTHFRFVNSTAIRLVFYDGATLKVIFRSGRGYDYHNVPPEYYQALISAQSVGVCFGLHIRDQFPHKKLTHEQVTEFLLDLAQSMSN